jgi:hypothetical protein
LENFTHFICLFFSLSFEHRLPRVFLELKLGNFTIGRIVIKLRMNQEQEKDKRGDDAEKPREEERVDAHEKIREMK